MGNSLWTVLRALSHGENGCGKVVEKRARGGGRGQQVFRKRPLPCLGERLGTARERSRARGLARRSAPLTAKTVVEDGGEGKGRGAAPPGPLPRAAFARGIKLPCDAFLSSDIRPSRADFFCIARLQAQFRLDPQAQAPMKHVSRSLQPAQQNRTEAHLRIAFIHRPPPAARDRRSR